VKTIVVIGNYPYESWMATALCRSFDPLIFYPDKGVKATRAKAICAECPHTHKCLVYSLKYGIRDGVWGGLSEQERRKMTRARRTRQAANPAS
jgi:WhiB family transcriptional regulator, redox-sensing transcriptional regulator